MIKKTKDYDMFVFRDDNREKIDRAHVQKLVQSITARNMLDLKPILVNEKMEIIDGQHRLLAAQKLDVEIYYDVQKNIDASDIIRLNTTKNWTTGDIFNFYCKHEYPEYLKLQEFMKKNQLSLKIAIIISIGKAHAQHADFKNGLFKFNDEIMEADLDTCWDTINYIKKMNGHSPYVLSAKFWQALLKIVQHYSFEADKWHSNVKKMVEHFTAKATTNDYVRMMQNIYNWRNNNKINLVDEL